MDRREAWNKKVVPANDVKINELMNDDTITYEWSIYAERINGIMFI
ncbi:MAG: hypothetical protein JXA22_00040 [Candidatus Thermoplasmatota archaeon]|nr:hypothetical protein [Candidatus Thermoplasmatota archaeon]